MLLNHDNAIPALNTIATQLLALVPSAEISIEYPAYLSISHNGREYHAGFGYDSENELNDTTAFELYEWLDGAPVADDAILRTAIDNGITSLTPATWVAIWLDAMALGLDASALGVDLRNA
jgi:hypothetical protein